MIRTLSLAVVVFVSLCCLAVAQEVGTKAVVPEKPGVFLVGESGLIELRELHPSQMGMKKAGKMFVPGLTPHMVQVFDGKQAPTRVSVMRPAFLVSGPIVQFMGRDFKIVRLDVKSDRRELQTTSGASMFTFKAGYSKERTVEVEIEAIGPDVIKLVPRQDLAPGEYMIVAGMAGVSGYDFGISPK
jgi:hypothetical protein